MDKPGNRCGFNMLFLLTELIGLAAVALMAVWIIHYRGGFAWTSDPDLQFNWHPFLNTIGMIYLFANSILVHRASLLIPRKTLIQIHIALHILVLLLTAMAYVTVFNVHSLKNKPNFYSLHSWLGIILVIIYVLQWIFGAIFFFPGIPPSVRAAVVQVHTFMGLAAFTMAIATASTGFTQMSKAKEDDSSNERYFINLTCLIFLLFGGLVVYLSTESKCRHVVQTRASV